jgi:hypothetical protein
LSAAIYNDDVERLIDVGAVGLKRKKKRFVREGGRI